ncbi:MAG: crossover junction endodeoxyribonuclease RuvC [Parcubacteria group bacterium CG1_02_40_82]|uniref:Crossover junction endodeoxyribonuclease RuvC n=4 Tax=Candidatus Portnoyibacteriota TaxID=1817913 RepID=A0A2M7IHI9_9BACT|nr:MAG: crossover junction endodeoxyribonuclease RuvC [Parcubacteria group bacterium CG1_02_40_82]PIQ75397.1 MAG: crossover junction endodeoxyribonuclease RuvC [Candidatus Portnoybacteria bacterium CG11_big_fil_rev_8_21_14_0_20_40_15]PIS31854.1 MAG: crossover junction endodeoxyribonuclease RuvC [Candidatus Portnoybacteria bacterium CG08_land_8_20_14_0_20_40_83]PIW75974.1 MAG: crossover junction endodeoxyribonuclease RuvC [Candidatus Portnoybacteria bacterium CG_4_8_14_3_um_filter_40_10]PIY74462
MIILGIDPGTAILGYGCIEAAKNKNRLIGYGCLKTPKNLNDAARLKILYQGITKLIKKFKPDYLALEEIFFFKNSKTVIGVSQARGITILAAANLDIPVIEFTPLQVKQAVTGYGRAEKQQVQKMIKVLLCLKEIPKPDDAADALATAICAAHCQKLYEDLTPLEIQPTLRSKK